MNFPKGDFPRDTDPSGNFPNVQFPKRQISKALVRPSEELQASMGPSAVAVMNSGAECRRLEQTSGRVLRLGQTWEVAALEFAHLGS